MSHISFSSTRLGIYLSDWLLCSHRTGVSIRRWSLWWVLSWIFQGPVKARISFHGYDIRGRGRFRFWLLTATTHPTSEQRRACIQGTISWFFWVVEEIVFNFFVSEQIGGHLLLYLILLFPLNTHTHFTQCQNPTSFSYTIARGAQSSTLPCVETKNSNRSVDVFLHRNNNIFHTIMFTPRQFKRTACNVYELGFFWGMRIWQHE